MGLSEKIKAEGVDGAQCRLGTAMPLCPVGSPETSVDVSLENSCSAFCALHVGFPSLWSALLMHKIPLPFLFTVVLVFFVLFSGTAFLSLHLSEYFKVLIPVLGAHKDLCSQTVGTQLYPVSVPGT